MKSQLLVLFAAILSGCSGGYEITELYQQKILNSEQSIVKYEAWSTLNDGAKYGYTIKTLGEEIDIAKAEQMPFRFLAGVPSNDTIFNVELIKGEGRIPKLISSKIAQLKGIVVVTDVYEYAIGNVRNLTCRFSSFRETDDSLIVEGVEFARHPPPVFGDEIGFKKGNVFLVESKEESGILGHIEIHAFILPANIGGLINAVTVLKKNSTQVSGQVIFKLIPTSRTLVSDFSNHGVYKKKEVSNAHKL